MGEGMVSTTCQPCERTHSATLAMAEFVRRGIAHDAALAHMLAPGLKLRLHQNDGFGKRGRRGQHRPKHKRGRDERNIHDKQRKRICDSCDGE